MRRFSIDGNICKAYGAGLRKRPAADIIKY